MVVIGSSIFEVTLTIGDIKMEEQESNHYLQVSNRDRQSNKVFITHKKE